MPKSVLSVKVRVVDLQIFNILEGIFTFHLYPVKGDVFAVEEQIFCFYGAVG